MTTVSMTAAEYRAWVEAHSRKRGRKAKGGRKNKFGAVAAFRCASCDGQAVDRETPCPSCRGTDILRFDSGMEARRWDHLRRLEKAGQITGLIRQERFPVTINGERVTVWRADFSYLDSAGVRHVEDVKGHDTDASRLRRRAVEAQHGISIEVVKK